MSNIQITSQMSALPAAQEFSMMKELATIAHASGLLPSAINTKEKVLIIMLKARELNIPPMLAFSHINVINGKPTMSSELMLTQIYKNIPKVIINFVETNAETCIIECQRPHGEKSRWEFNMLDAANAGIAGKGPWKTYPSAMLRARCISSMARAVFPDVLNGVSYTAEELGADVDVDSEGNETIKDVSPAQKSNTKIQKEKASEPKPKEENKPIIQEKIEEPIFQEEQEIEPIKQVIDEKPKFNLNKDLEFQKIENGKLAGKCLNECAPEDLLKYIQGLEKYSQDNKIELQSNVLELIWMIKKYLGME